MGIEVGLNLRVVFKDTLPKELVDWFAVLEKRSTGDVSCTVEVCRKLAPQYIVERAEKCILLASHTGCDEERYKFVNDSDGMMLTMYANWKMREYEWEKFVNYIMPYVVVEKSLGFINWDCNGDIYKITFIPSVTMDELKRTEPFSPEGVCGVCTEDMNVRISDDIDYLEEVYERTKKKKEREIV